MKHFVTTALMLAAAGCATTTPPAPVAFAAAPEPPPPASPAPPPPPRVSPALQAATWSFGTGETAALSHQAFGQLTRYVAAELPKLRRRAPYASAVLDDTATAVRRCTPATQRRPAVIFDVDETLLMNIGHGYDQTRLDRPYDPAIWSRWERESVDLVQPLPGAVTALARLRAQGVTLLYVSNRSAANAAFTARAIDRAGLGPALHLENMLLQGDLDPSSRKDSRRARFAQAYCVVALVGDQMGDFTDTIDQPPGAPAKRPLLERRAEVDTRWASRFGRGWFILPNPMYGGWNTPAATLDQTVPPNLRWYSADDRPAQAPPQIIP